MIRLDDDLRDALLGGEVVLLSEWGESVEAVRNKKRHIMSAAFLRNVSERMAFARFAVEHYRMPDGTWAFAIAEHPERFIIAFVDDEREHVVLGFPPQSWEA